ncbi:MAG: SMC-Scp complex subunit ScpB [Acidobacteria bacterium]|nr:SMC-Scp complex subunit ScpB [Acidobacteriota bacterium]
MTDPDQPDTPEALPTTEPDAAEAPTGVSEDLAETFTVVPDEATTVGAVPDAEAPVPAPDEPAPDAAPAEERALDDEPAVFAPVADDADEAAEGPKPRMDLQQLKAIVEALIFASPEPLSPKSLFKVLADEPKEDVLAAIEAVKADYAERPGLHVAEVAGGLQVTTRPELHEWVRRLFHERTTQKLSVASLETLSVIAYKQPITQAEIAEIRGVNASGVISTLLERHLVKIVGRKNVVGRPFLYGTTREFLIRFGLKDVNDLPRIEDMAQQLGFDPPPVLMERNVTDDMLPLEEGEGDDEAAGDLPDDDTSAPEPSGE